MAAHRNEEPEDIREGRIFAGRRALTESGFHPPPQAGIARNAQGRATSIVLNGGYENEDNGHTIEYTGHGGYDSKTGKQIKDQSWNSFGNKALLKSEKSEKPVRVFRGSKHISKHSPESGYKYAGLYYVVKHYQSRSNGYLICRFKLVKEKPVQEEESPVSATVAAQEVPLETQIYQAVQELKEDHGKEKETFQEPARELSAPERNSGGIFHFLKQFYRRVTINFKSN